jgi:hypothetical protein
MPTRPVCVFNHADGNCLHAQNRLKFDWMDAIFRKLIDNNLSDLAGLTVDASVPVPEHIVNEIIEVTLRGNKNITACHVSIGGQNKVSVNLKTPLWLWPINIKLQLASSLDISGSPKIRASLENNVFLGKLGAWFKALPAGVNIYGDQVIVDIQSLLETPEQRKLLELIQSVQIRTEPARVIFDIQIKVEQE